MKLPIIFSLCWSLVSVSKACIKYNLPSHRLNTHLNVSAMSVYSATDFSSCAKACLLLTGCLSANFNLTGKQCGMNNVTAPTGSVDFVVSPGSVFLDMTDWAGVFVGPCSGKPCGVDQVCIPAFNSRNCLNLELPLQNSMTENPETTTALDALRAVSSTDIPRSAAERITATSSMTSSQSSVVLSSSYAMSGSSLTSSLKSGFSIFQLTSTSIGDGTTTAMFQLSSKNSIITSNAVSSIASASTNSKLRTATTMNIMATSSSEFTRGHVSLTVMPGSTSEQFTVSTTEPLLSSTTSLSSTAPWTSLVTVGDTNQAATSLAILSTISTMTSNYVSSSMVETVLFTSTPALDAVLTLVSSTLSDMKADTTQTASLTTKLMSISKTMTNSIHISSSSGGTTSLEPTSRSSSELAIGSTPVSDLRSLMTFTSSTESVMLSSSFSKSVDGTTKSKLMQTTDSQSVLSANKLTTATTTTTTIYLASSITLPESSTTISSMIPSSSVSENNNVTPTTTGQSASGTRTLYLTTSPSHTLSTQSFMTTDYNSGSSGMVTSSEYSLSSGLQFSIDLSSAVGMVTGSLRAVSTPGMQSSTETISGQSSLSEMLKDKTLLASSFSTLSSNIAPASSVSILEGSFGSTSSMSSMISITDIVTGQQSLSETRIDTTFLASSSSIPPSNIAPANLVSILEGSFGSTSAISSMISITESFTASGSISDKSMFQHE